MKKILTIVALFISTAISAHYNNRSNFFNDGFLSNFERQFQEFSQQITRLQYYPQLKQYFDKDSNTYILEIKAQGIDKNNLAIETTSNRITIKSKQTKNTNNARSSSAFSFTTSIPDDADADNMTIDFKDNVLKISIPKL